MEDELKPFPGLYQAEMKQVSHHGYKSDKDSECKY